MCGTRSQMEMMGKHSAATAPKNKAIPNFPMSSLFPLQSCHWPRRSLLSAWASLNLNTSAMPKLTMRSALVRFFVFPFCIY